CHQDQNANDPNVILTKCQHCFHNECLMKQISKDLKCPYCDQILEEL
ncbi:MAG: hypothetical protein EZS28_012336, partial [Streblomastix strix]